MAGTVSPGMLVREGIVHGGETRRVPVLVANCKALKTSRAGAEFVTNLAQRLGDARDREVLVAPPLPGFSHAIEAAQGTGVGIAAQDASAERGGAYAWMPPAETLSSLGVRAAIVGHFERRRLPNEAGAVIGKKVRATLDCGLSPIVSIGEAEGQQGLTKWWLFKEVREAVEAVCPEEAASLIIAYEPTWMTERGKRLHPEIAQEALAFVRSCLFVVLGSRAASSVRLLWGGGVDPVDVDWLMAQPDVDGILVKGRTNLDFQSCLRIAQLWGTAREEEDGRADNRIVAGTLS